jgi:transcriptional regulator with PAS, ATPase and Fis domain
MKPGSPTERCAELRTAEATPGAPEIVHSPSPTPPAERAALRLEVEQLAATVSVTATLEMAARLLAEIGISINSLQLDRSGFTTTVWKASQDSERSTIPATKTDANAATCSMRVGTITLEARCCASLERSAEQAVGAVLRAAAIQAERLSRRAWQFATKEGSRNDSPMAHPANKTSPLLSEKARKLEQHIERVARFPHGIIITGETGTGKTVSARQIHAKSARASMPFVELNCAAIPEHLVEAELFGYRKGAFTGADRDHKGLFEEAEGGFLFLDEIGDLPQATQNKLLKAIDEKQVKRLGTNQYIHCDVQIIAATSRDLRAMIRCGSFREDLYCRLAVLRIETVPLRERREDIPVLIDIFLREAEESVSKLTGGREEYSIETGAVEMLCAHHWTGNIRVLRNAIFELTSFVASGEMITMERAGDTLAWLNNVASGSHSNACDKANFEVENSRGILYSSAQLAESLQALAQEGDIVLPLEVCLLRRGETLKEWVLRAKQCGIEAAWRTSSTGKLREAAKRLGLDYTNIKSQLSRTRYRSSKPRSRRSME